jgi:molybdopterin converting factor small subunit
MSATIKLSEIYHEHTGNQDSVAVQGSTVKECLDQLVSLFPALRPLLFDSEYALGVLIIYKGDVITMSNIDRPVLENDELTLLPMIYGG